MKYFAIGRFGPSLVILRTFLSIPAHLFFGAIWGYALGQKLVKPRTRRAPLRLDRGDRPRRVRRVPLDRRARDLRAPPEPRARRALRRLPAPLAPPRGREQGVDAGRSGEALHRARRIDPGLRGVDRRDARPRRAALRREHPRRGGADARRSADARGDGPPRRAARHRGARPRAHDAARRRDRRVRRDVRRRGAAVEDDPRRVAIAARAARQVERGRRVDRSGRREGDGRDRPRDRGEGRRAYLDASYLLGAGATGGMFEPMGGAFTPRNAATTS